MYLIITKEIYPGKATQRRKPSLWSIGSRLQAVCKGFSTKYLKTFCTWLYSLYSLGSIPKPSSCLFFFPTNWIKSETTLLNHLNFILVWKIEPVSKYTDLTVCVCIYSEACVLQFAPLGLQGFNSVASRTVTNSLPIPLFFWERAKQCKQTFISNAITLTLTLNSHHWIPTLVCLLSFEFLSLYEEVRSCFDLLHPCCPDFKWKWSITLVIYILQQTLTVINEYFCFTTE